MKRTLIFPTVLKKVIDRNLKKYSTLTCEICKQPIDGVYHFDHIVPVSKFSKKKSPFRMNGIRNLQIACERCNLKKSNTYKKQTYKTL